MTRKSLTAGWISVCLIYLCLNYTWTHAAVAGAIYGRECPDQIIDSAKDSVVQLFGDVTAKSWIYCLDRSSAGLSIEYGTTRFAPLLPSIIVLGPFGQNRDVASHELVHAELAERTSVLLRTYRIPTWFDEGLAMQVDARAEYTVGALQAKIQRFPLVLLRLEDLSTPSEFFGHGERSAMHYAFARCVVGEAIAEMGVDELHGIALNVRWLSNFPEAEFSGFADKCSRPEQSG